jgi:hypothetical protein
VELFGFEVFGRRVCWLGSCFPPRVRRSSSSASFRSVLFDGVGELDRILESRLERALGVGLDPLELASMYLSRKCCSQPMAAGCFIICLVYRRRSFDRVRTKRIDVEAECNLLRNHWSWQSTDISILPTRSTRFLPYIIGPAIRALAHCIGETMYSISNRVLHRNLSAFGA